MAATFEVTTRQGLNYEVSTHRLPLYLKLLQFLDRSAQYEQIAEEITDGAQSDTERVLRVFEWTQRHIKDTPQGWTVVDDHILNIIIRGHGVQDQQADVFCTLSTYGDVPAFWSRVPPNEAEPGIILSFAQVDGRWRVFDVANNLVFRTASGELATIEEIGAQPDAVPPATHAIRLKGGIGYVDVLKRASLPPVPDPLRAELQMPSQRLWYELGALFGGRSD